MAKKKSKEQQQIVLRNNNQIVKAPNNQIINAPNNQMINRQQQEKQINKFFSNVDNIVEIEKGKVQNEQLNAIINAMNNPYAEMGGLALVTFGKSLMVKGVSMILTLGIMKMTQKGWTDKIADWSGKKRVDIELWMFTTIYTLAEGVSWALAGAEVGGAIGAGVLGVGMGAYKGYIMYNYLLNAKKEFRRRGKEFSLAAVFKESSPGLAALYNSLIPESEFELKGEREPLLREEFKQEEELELLTFDEYENVQKDFIGYSKAHSQAGASFEDIEKINEINDFYKQMETSYNTDINQYYEGFGAVDNTKLIKNLKVKRFLDDYKYNTDINFIDISNDADFYAQIENNDFGYQEVAAY